MFCMDQKNELQHIDLIDKQKNVSYVSRETYE